MSGREFFTARTVSEALTGFRPSRRTAVEPVALADLWRRVPAAHVTAPEALPGFARSTVDGFAVRAADTYGASEGLPSYLELAGALRMGVAPSVAVPPGGCLAIPTGAALPDGADAVVMVEYTAETMPGTIEVTRPVAPGGGVVRASEDVAAGAVLGGGGQAAPGRGARAPRRRRGDGSGRARPPPGGDHLDRRRGGAPCHRQAGRRRGPGRHRLGTGRAGARVRR